MRLIYAANARIPSEKAHPYQIVQMCEAFAGAGADVTLLYAGRRNPPHLRTEDIWGYYGVERNFAAERIPVVDLYPLAGRLPGRLRLLMDRLAGVVEKLTFNAALMARLARERDAVVYSRHAIGLGLLAALWPRRARRAFYEAHTAPATRAGRRLRRWFIRRIGGVIAITGHLRERHIALGAAPERVLVARDGFRTARFEIEGDRAHWRAQFGWPQEAFIVGYMGRFHTLGMDKGVGTLLDALVAVTRQLARDGVERPVCLALVGGPAEVVEALRERLRSQGLPPDLILFPGQVPAQDVPGYLRAFDVCVMPFPWTEHFAYYASPMKLFEYMASGRPIVASDLPSTAEVLTDGENALLVPPSDPAALAAAVRRLHDDPALGGRLAAQARQDVQAHAWSARAERILAFIGGRVDAAGEGEEA